MVESVNQPAGTSSVQPSLRDNLPDYRARSGAFRGDSSQRTVSKASDAEARLPRSSSVDTNSKSIRDRVAKKVTPETTLPSSTTASEKSSSTKEASASKPLNSPDTEKLMTSDEVKAIAGNPKRFRSPTYKAALDALDKYNAGNFKSKAQQLELLDKLESTSKAFHLKKAGESNGVLSPRLEGAQKFSKSVVREQDRVLDECLKEILENPNQFEVSRAVGHLPAKTVANRLAQMPVEPRTVALNSILTGLRLEQDIDEADHTHSLDIVIDLMKEPNVNPSDHYSDLDTVVSEGPAYVNSKSAKHAYDRGVMNIDLFRGIGSKNIISYSSGFTPVANAAANIQLLNRELLAGTQALQSIDEIGPISSSDDSRPDAIKRIALQTNAFTLYELLLKAKADPPFDMMIRAWDQINYGDMIEYNAPIERFNAAHKGDKSLKKPEASVESPEFTNEMKKLDVSFFKARAAGKPVPLEKLGWKPLPDNWRTDPAITPTPAEVAQDFFFQYAQSL
ncbi:hypothetical protein EOPP23_02760 [Endozoicomonas sp. OPT23]|uniref:hypothetical protein n=1 Tax=Endozoicomonas sp. OPT23 TaxID=2072845 RepID=UPI00129B736D|nr:hypothetical protein [Endozoicomonas sp. OPT23]MRI31918.1 hypothetical protein [Endozoicomonas sp. OPT23]